MGDEHRKIGPYEIVRLVGKGGMSEVYEVEHVRLGSRHALKFFAYDKDDAEVKARFLTEGRLLARLAHPRIVKVTDFGTDEASGKPYFVMDLIRDERGMVRSLGDIAPGTADEETVGKWYDDLREGLAYIHANGVVHRDLKLQNILIGPDSHAVITDFGISKIFERPEDEKKVVDTLNTIVKMKEGRNLVMGSIGYMAPELEMGVAASPQSDYYALGVIIYRLLTGSWCDSRTDIVSALDTYDGVWKRIIPKLLHSNPQARECPAYAEGKRAEWEQAEAQWEEKWLNEKRRGHLARHLARWAAAALVLVSVAGAIGLMRYDMERKLWRAERRFGGEGRSICEFDDIFRLPADAKADDLRDPQGRLVMPARDGLAASRIDLMVITHDLFSALNAGNITLEKAIEDLDRLRDGFADDSISPFDRWPSGYMQVGDDAATYWLLDEGIKRLEALSER